MQYSEHAALGHKTSFHSPDGVNKIEECGVCGKTWMHHVGCKWAIFMRGYSDRNSRAISDAERKRIKDGTTWDYKSV